MAKAFDDFEDPEDTKSQLGSHRIFKTRVPNAREVGEGQFVLSKVSGTVKLHTKVDGVVVSVTLS